MPLINQSLPNLVQGVSQQPPINRFEGQAEEQVNAISSVVDGLSKRPNTRHLGELLTTSISSNAFVHFIDRSENEKYVVIHDGSTLKAFNLDGTPCTINGASSLTTSSVTYINSATPRENLKALTVGDTTFLLNKTVQVGASSNNTSSLEKTAVITIKQGDYEKDYRVHYKTVDSSGNDVQAQTSAHYQSGGSGGSTPTSSNANSNSISFALRTVLTGTTSWNSNFTTNYQTGSNNIYGTLRTDVNANNDDFEISTTDSLSDTGMSVAYKEINSITDLPVENKNGFRIKVRGAADLNEDDYYVAFETNHGQTYGKGTYTETVGFGISEGLDNNDMPHKLVNTALNTFTFGTASYASRTVGDDDTNPQPSFQGTTITNLFFFKNRLGFLTEDKVIMSEAGEPFNFYRTTVTTLLDSDPIDVQVSSQKVTNLQSAVGFQENLILFSENSQFVLKGGDMLTPKTVSVTPVTNFDASSKVNPIPLGAYMYFPVEGTNFSSIREYTVNASTDVYDSTDITEHVPAYIPSNVTMFAGTSTKDALALVSPDEANSIYVYRYFFNGQKKLLSSWFKFVVDGDVRGLSFSKSDLYIVISYNNKTQLVRMPFNENLKDKDDAPVDLPNSEHATYLDFRTLLTVAQGDTSVALPYDLPAGTLQCYTGNGAQISGSNNSTHFNFTSPITADQAGKIWVGKPFTMTYVFSELIFKDQAGSGKSASNSSRMMLKNGTIFFSNTKRFQVEVKPSKKSDRDVQTDIFTTDVVGQTVVGDPVVLEDGKFRFPIFSDATDTKITVTDDSIFPLQLTSAEFEGLVKPRSKRIG